MKNPKKYIKDTIRLIEHADLFQSKEPNYISLKIKLLSTLCDIEKADYLEFLLLYFENIETCQ